MSSGRKPQSRHATHPSRSKSTGKQLKEKSASKASLELTESKPEISKLSKSRQILTDNLNTYTLLIRSNNPIRCLLHNSNISMYCETQQKLLCANCIFGRTEHKFHRVTPIDKSLDKIEKDVDTMARLIDREMNIMAAVAQKLNQNLVKEEDATHTGLSSLIDLYQECHRRLEQNFLISKEKIIAKFNQARHKYQNLMVQLSRLTQEYGMSGIVKTLQKDYFKKQEILLYEHSICSSIVKQRKFEEKDWLPSKIEVEAAVADERKRILIVLQMIKKIKPPSP